MPTPVTDVSICCRSQKAPIDIHWYVAEPSELQMMPRFRSLFVGLPLVDADRDRFTGEFRDRVLLASEGRLREPNNVDGPLRKPTNIDLFEMRWRFEYGLDETIRVRMYHVEPRGFGSLVVALHMHVKDVTPGIDVGAAQDGEISIAAGRYWDGKPANWGR